MKKLLYFSLFSAFLFTSCSTKEAPETPENLPIEDVFEWIKDPSYLAQKNAIAAQGVKTCSISGGMEGQMSKNLFEYDAMGRPTKATVDEGQKLEKNYTYKSDELFCERSEKYTPIGAGAASGKEMKLQFNYVAEDGKLKKEQMRDVKGGENSSIIYTWKNDRVQKISIGEDKRPSEMELLMKHNGSGQLTSLEMKGNSGASMDQSVIFSYSYLNGRISKISKAEPDPNNLGKTAKSVFANFKYDSSGKLMSITQEMSMGYGISYKITHLFNDKELLTERKIEAVAPGQGQNKMSYKYDYTFY